MSAIGAVVSLIKRFNCVSNTQRINQLKLEMKEMETQLETLTENCLNKDHFEHYKEMHYQTITHIKDSMEERIDELKMRMSDLLAKYETINENSHEQAIDLACIKTMIGYLDQLKTKSLRK